MIVTYVLPSGYVCNTKSLLSLGNTCKGLQTNSLSSVISLPIQHPLSKGTAPSSQGPDVVGSGGRERGREDRGRGGLASGGYSYYPSPGKKLQKDFPPSRGIASLSHNNRADARPSYRLSAQGKGQNGDALLESVFLPLALHQTAEFRIRLGSDKGSVQSGAGLQQ